MFGYTATHSPFPACLASFAMMALAHPAAAQDAKPAELFFYSGTVVDSKGRPVAEVRVVATHRHSKGRYGYIGTTRTDSQGRFTIKRAEALSGATPESIAGETVRLDFLHPSYAYERLEDQKRLSPQTSNKLSITLKDGRAIDGRVVDEKHRPVKAALVEAVFGDEVDLRRATKSDASGRFLLRGLPSMAGQLRILTTEAGQEMLTGSTKFDAKQQRMEDVALSVIKLPPGSAVHELLGMKLVSVDAAVQKSFHLHQAGGVVVLDPGVDSARLQVGKLQRGDHFWDLDGRPIENFDDFKARLSAITKQGHRAARVVYDLSREHISGSNTQILELNDADIASLKK